MKFLLIRPEDIDFEKFPFLNYAVPSLQFDDGNANYYVGADNFDDVLSLFDYVDKVVDVARRTADNFEGVQTVDRSLLRPVIMQDDTDNRFVNFTLKPLTAKGTPTKFPVEMNWLIDGGGKGWNGSLSFDREGKPAKVSFYFRPEPSDCYMIKAKDTGCLVVDKAIHYVG